MHFNSVMFVNFQVSAIMCVRHPTAYLRWRHALCLCVYECAWLLVIEPPGGWVTTGRGRWSGHYWTALRNAVVDRAWTDGDT
ncbi:unnamed protein product [Linum tenue]|uniref:Secreted protein n=1 Tax=Linum tenue TaxID=586396 RepID=A0AAV0NVV0_9ROSI|nr:unnamed protein product [Linum tenue]CAI0462868.1 unnamed protein product [Linum tenue]